MGRLPKATFKSELLLPQNMTSSGNRVVADVVKMKSCWSRVGLLSDIIGVFIQRRCEDRRGEHHAKTPSTEGRWPREDRQRLELVFHKPRNSWGHQKLEEVRKDPPTEPLEGAWPWPHLDSVLLASRTMRE